MSASLPMPDNVALAPGAIIGGKYRIDGFLGAGGMGVVLSATHLELGAPVAIKIVRDDLAQHEEVVSRLLFEARAAARMRSSHIVRVLDVARLDSGAPYIVMEQLEGLDLAAVLAEAGTLTATDAVNYLLQACEGLNEAHALGVVHRDLKPENLFLANTPEGVVLKILDFGISKDLGTSISSGARSTLTKKGAAIGSPFYMSPEQMAASPTLDARADVWSLGAILFELLTGHCPFEADSTALVCSKVLVDQAPSLRDFDSNAPAGLDAIIQRCLQKEPEERFQSASELASALREFDAAQRGAAAAELATLEQEVQKPRRFASALALLTVSALLAVAGVVFWRMQGQSEWARWFGTSAAAAETETAARRHKAPPEGAPEAVPVSVAAASAAAPPPPDAAVHGPSALSTAAKPPLRYQPSWPSHPESAAHPLYPVPSPPPLDLGSAPPLPFRDPAPSSTVRIPPAPGRDGVDARYDL
ncbi:MAG: serine/threonine-protein kinase, partial [Pseudomonadota bacterium]